MMMWDGETPAASRPSQMAWTMGRWVESNGPPMVVILMPTTSCGVMPRRVQAVPRSDALVNLRSALFTICRAIGPLTLKRCTTSGFSVQMTGESVRGGGGGAEAVDGGAGGLASPDGTASSAETPTTSAIEMPPMRAMRLSVRQPRIRRKLEIILQIGESRVGAAHPCPILKFRPKSFIRFR